MNIKPFLLGLFFVFFISITCNAQNLLTSGMTAGSGAAKDDISIDLAIGQTFSKPYVSNQLMGNEGILQVIIIKPDATHHQDLSGIGVYPNPVNMILNIDLPCNSKYRLQLMGASGKVIINQVSECKTQLDLSHFTSGFYFLKIQKGLYSKSFKIIKY